MDIYSLTDNAILQQIGVKLKEERLKQNVSQKSLSEMCGLAQSSISLIEKGKNGSTLSIVMMLRALNRFDLLEGLFAEKPISPIEYSELMKKTKQRKNASSKRGQNLSAAELPNDFEWDKD